MLVSRPGRQGQGAHGPTGGFWWRGVLGGSGVCVRVREGLGPGQMGQKKRRLGWGIQGEWEEAQA